MVVGIRLFLVYEFVCVSGVNQVVWWCESGCVDCVNSVVLMV